MRTLNRLHTPTAGLRFVIVLTVGVCLAVFAQANCKRDIPFQSFFPTEHTNSATANDAYRWLQQTPAKAKNTAV